ncbi:hypothetical protein LZ30DRAFT_723574 [Colletotrichum cereale]|nr:hypothetical protein LZ30DRAFT_723574 [Colletotrichum cereale]
MPTGPVTSIPYGTAISSCTVEGDFALTFDDGPTSNTDHILDLLAEAGFKATFFVNGNLLSNIMDQQPRIKRILADGHQLGHHTYNHADLVKLNNSEIAKEMSQLEEAFINITGKYPTYMRFPYFSFDSRTLSVMKDLQYHTVWADIDTNDWKYNTLGDRTSLGLFQSGVDAGGTLCLCHDVSSLQSATLLTTHS